MKAFTAKGKLRHFDAQEDRMISMEDGDTLQVRDDLAEFFCSHGWGTAPGVETKPAKPGVVTLEVK